ncbi:tyrosine-type recombinase/integrase [Actinacidiphila glaucinigra]|uniref:tyrosine-type recombinase/integrase n=1 Tax=Actinacidiphila glaucinigra TaxID=235986 RepID=UPI003680484F
MPEVSWFTFCRDYVRDRWPDIAAKTRDGITDGLATATLAMLGSDRDRPSDEDLRAAIRWAMIPRNADVEPPAALARSIGWLQAHSRPVADLQDKKLADQVAKQVTRLLDGAPAASDTARRRRRALNTAMEHAVTEGILLRNPLTDLKRKRVARNDAVDPRVLVNPEQARELLMAVAYVGSWDRARGRRLQAFFGTLYYAGCRPSECVGLRVSGCHLPDTGWGRLMFDETLPVVSKQWTDHGKRHDPRGLKQREREAVRPVPIPPVLVQMLRTHLQQFGEAEGGRVFGNERRKPIGASTYSRTWEEARQLALTPAQVQSPLGGRPYDLRHSCLTGWLNAGVPPAEVARRAGNSVEVLYRRYAGCLDGQEDAVNRRIQAALQ